MNLRIGFLLLDLILIALFMAAMPIASAVDETNTTTISTNVAADAWIGSSSTPITFSEYDTFGYNTVTDAVTVKCNQALWTLKVKDSKTGANTGYLVQDTTNLTYPLEVLETTYSDLTAERTLVSSGAKGEVPYVFTYRQRGSAVDPIADGYTISLTYTITYSG